MSRASTPSQSSSSAAPLQDLPFRRQERYNRCDGTQRASPRAGEMASMGQVDLLEPVELAEHLHKLELYLGQVCLIAGISKMQLDYWTNKAQIPTKGKK